MLNEVPAAFARCASSIAQARPAGPAPTISTSSSIRSPAPSAPALRMSLSSGSGGWYRAGRTSAMELLDLGGEPGHDLEQIADHPVVRHLEDRCVLVLVDRHDHLRRPHPREVLDRARDPDRDVERGAHRLPRLADLVGVGPPAGVHHGARCAHRRAAPERLGQFLEHPEVRGLLQSPPPRDHDLGFGDVERVRFRGFDLAHGHPARRDAHGRRLSSAFPAYTGRVTTTAPLSTPTSVTSVASATPSFAATRGARSLPVAVAAKRTAA